MKTVCSFVTKVASVVSWILSCFDRVILKGHLPISRPCEFEKFVDGELKVRRADFFKVIGPKWSQRLVDHALGFAKKHGRIFHRESRINKDAWAKEQLDWSPLKDRLIGVMEACPTFKLAYGKERPRFVPQRVPQRVLYNYFIDRELGLSIADRFAKLPWPKILERYARLVNPLLLDELKGMSHYWVIDRAEYATDLCFVSKHSLAAVDDPTPIYDDLKQLTDRQTEHGRSDAGFNPAREDEVRLFAAVLGRGPHRAGVLQQRHPDHPLCEG